jgi:hypothetical protein
MDTHTNTEADSEQLPAAIRTYLDAQEARDPDAALAVLSPDAVISDVGEAFSGEQGLRRFITEAGAEFTVTTEITSVARDGGTWVVGHHLEGDFPGGTADLDYRFTLDGDRIQRLDIVLGHERQVPA